MKLCGKCLRKPWPYAIIIFISSFVAFVTWLTLSAAGVTPGTNQWWTGAAFVAAGSVLFTYMRACMRRHCREDHHHQHAA